MLAVGAQAAERIDPPAARCMRLNEGNAETRRSLRILRAVEAYKAACAAEGQQPTEEDSWLVLLAALNAPLD